MKNKTWLIAAVLAVGTAVLTYFLISLSQTSYIQQVIVHNNQVYLLKTTVHHSEDGDYTSHKVYALNTQYEVNKKVKLGYDVNAIHAFNKHLLATSNGAYNKIDNIYTIDYYDLSVRKIDEKFLYRYFFAGIHEVSRTRSPYFIRVTDLAGKVSAFNLETFEIIPFPKDEYQLPELLNQFSVDETSISLDHYSFFKLTANTPQRTLIREDRNSKEIKSGMVTQKDLEEEQKQQALNTYKEQPFLMGQFLGISKEHNLVLIMEATDMTRSRFTLNALHFEPEFKLAWKIPQHYLNISTNKYSKKHFSVGFTKQHVLFTYETTLYVLDKQNGNLVKTVSL